MYQLISATAVRHKPSGTVIPLPACESYGFAYEKWLAQGNTPQPIAVAPMPTQLELDTARYTKRAAAKDGLIAFMAADNMSRVRSGAWTVPELSGLLSDPALSSALELIAALSFEMAAQALSAATHPMLTPEIKAKWVGKLQDNFFLTP